MTGPGDRALLRWLEAKPDRAARIFAIMFIVAQLHLWGGITAVMWIFIGPTMAIWFGSVVLIIMVWWTLGVLRTARYRTT